MSPYGKVSFVSFLLIHYTRRGAALVSDDPGKIFYELSLLQIQNPQILHMKKRETGLSQKKKAVGLHTAFSFYSCFQGISIKYGMIVFQNLMISFSSIEYGCSRTCSCQKQDPCPKHWIPIVSGLS